jgi:hypothetical protein
MDVVVALHVKKLELRASALLVIPAASSPLVFFDPEFPGPLDRLNLTEREASGQLLLGFAEIDSSHEIWEYAVLATSVGGLPMERRG